MCVVLSGGFGACFASVISVGLKLSIATLLFVVAFVMDL